MTLQEIDQELMRLPASPTTPEDTEARHLLMVKRFEVQAAARKAAAERAAAEKKRQWGLPLVNVPGDISCLSLPNGRIVYTDIVDGRRVAQLTAGDLLQLSISNDAWLRLNPDLARSL
jgi:succinyl-CoA synthetase beta subunit